ncbi:MAG TPA: chromosomal replication initiator protein DnaA [Ktedonobacteraceae bacterium]|nr:chromosomal replication initiator protein DnaA [Ktedonobacteraceae bacterium]
MVNVASIWQTALERLDLVPLDAVYQTWLRAASLIQAPDSGGDDLAASSGEETLCLQLTLPTSLAQDVINKRLRHTIEELLADIAGQPVSLSFAHKMDGSTSMHETAPGTFDGDSHRPASRSAMEEYAYYELPTPSHEAQFPVRETYPTNIVQRAGAPYLPSVADALTEDWDHEQRANILMHNRLNPRYSFETFIVGNSNRLAHAASQAVAEAPGESYNPLFLYGGVGLGKTHLLHAIGHQGVHTGLAVLYVSSEQFTNEIVNAIRYRTTEEFRAKYRSVDILLVDDIQFIAGKESTEEEFFHTFNSLYEMSKQIVICSDRPPKAIVSLEERLRSRFEWGLIADIQPPDLETRMAILRVKADALRYRVPDEIIAYIAGRVQTNIRELEGCLNRLMAYQQLHHTELTMEVARAAMSSLGEDVRESRLNGRQIAEVVAEFYHISLEAMCGKQRDKHIVMPRQIAMYLIRQETQVSLLEIGQLFGGRDHSTVLHACEKIDRAVNINPTLRREIVSIREQLLRD